MLEQNTLDFLASLACNNNKEWFEQNKPRYLQARKNMEEVTQRLIREIARFHPSLAHLRPEDCLFRIYRDVRFSKDKSPYKIHMGAFMSEEGKNSLRAGYYFHVQPHHQSFLAGGMYMPPTWLLHAVRQEIDYHLDEFKNILNAPSFRATFGTLQGDTLKTAPKGYDKKHPGIDLLRHKSFIVIRPLQDEDLLAPHFIERAAEIFRAMYPFNQFLNRVFQ